MFKPSLLTKFFLLFTVIFMALIIASNNDLIRTQHCKFFASIEAPILNILNPHVFVEITEGAIENDQDWDVTFKVWDKRQYGRQLFVKQFRDRNLPKAILYQNHHEILLVPSLFLLALMLASPLSTRKKLIKTLVAFILFYLFTTLYLSYRFEWSINRQELPLDSIWHVLISFFGLGGNTDPIYIFVFLLWIVLVLPPVVRDKYMMT